MAAMRAAKERKRLARAISQPEPKTVRWHRFEFAVRDKQTGQTAWHDLRQMEVYAIDGAGSLPFRRFFPRRLRVVAECLAVGAIGFVADFCYVS
jgi:hypothetical protein